LIEGIVVAVLLLSSSLWVVPFRMPDAHASSPVATALPGVKPGDNATYVFMNTSDTLESLTRDITVQVTAVSGANITYTTNWYLLTGTIYFSATETLDVQTQSYCLTYIIPSYFSFCPFWGGTALVPLSQIPPSIIASGLQAPDPIGMDPSITLNRTETLTVLGVERTVNELHWTLTPVDNQVTSISYVWDQPTGILVAVTHSAGTGNVTSGDSLVLASTNLWGPPASPSFGMSSDPSNVIVQAGGGPGNSTITIGSISGFTGTVVLRASTSSPQLFCSLSPMSVVLSSLGSTTVTLICSGSSGGTYGVTVTGASGNLSRTVRVTYTVLSAIGGTLLTNLTVGSEPYGVAYDSGNGYIYATNEASGTVSVINGTTVVATIRVGPSPVGVAYNSRNGYVYVVSNAPGNGVSVIRNTTVVATVPVAGYPVGVAYDSENGYVYVANGYTANSVSVINGTNLVTTVPVGGFPAGVGYNSGNGYIYVTNAFSDTVSVINGTAVIATVPVGDYPVGVASNIGNGYVYVTNSFSNSVSVINQTTVVTTIPLGLLGSGPFGVAYNTGNGYVYDSDYNSNSVSVINGTSLLATKILVGNQPVGVAYDPDNGYVYVANNGGNTVSVISTKKPIPKPIHLTVTGVPIGPVLAGDSISLSAIPDGGTPPFAFTWTKNGLTFATSQNITDTPEPGTVDYEVTVTDSLGTMSEPTTTSIAVYDFAFSGNPAILQVLTSGWNTYAITEGLATGSTPTELPTIRLSLQGLPSGAMSSFSLASGDAGGFTSVLNVTTANVPAGTYTLTLTGTDDRASIGGNRSSSLFLSVITPSQAILKIENLVSSLKSSGILNSGQSNSLFFKLKQAVTILGASRPASSNACGILASFVNQVNSYVATGILTRTQADRLLGGPLGMLAIESTIPC